MFKITKESIKKLISRHTSFSKEAAEFLSGYLIDKNSSMPIDCFIASYLDNDRNKRIGISVIPEVIEETFEEINKKDIVSFMNRIQGFNINAVIYESNNIIIYQH
ncbi:hypothetical protein [Brachyspira hampsonii]|uniref:Uncharacterized protein n=1 Tax=Brachyspira hampsonii TaxID=1287055 RepID=A0AAC9TUP5_9SPIR|nr:hypothetical protein [Brachyspira hampsonii]ASJ21562.1 hypothetical protein BHAMNSH16_07860 [Brachyspira hampsonii]ELV05257.1 hypothetical protein H263_11350 [Brachyspira hampsonii 30599]OEJ18481.1 hypothetical protein A9496_07435 [Brachyspira hampsonii]